MFQNVILKVTLVQLQPRDSVTSWNEDLKRQMYRLQCTATATEPERLNGMGWVFIRKLHTIHLFSAASLNRLLNFPFSV